MKQMAIDINQRRAIVPLFNNMIVPKFVIQSTWFHEWLLSFFQIRSECNKRRLIKQIHYFYHLDYF